MITADQLVLHFVGDYLLQSGWMATQKSKKVYVAAVHALVYALPFLLLRPSMAAFAFIVVTHTAMDRLRLARYLVWAKNWLGPYRPLSWSECRETGYPPSQPAWMNVWLLIIVDNTLHVIMNGFALAYL